MLRVAHNKKKKFITTLVLMTVIDNRTKVNQKRVSHHDKIVFHHQQGWSQSMIAQECNITQPTVHYHIHRDGRKDVLQPKNKVIQPPIVSGKRRTKLKNILKSNKRSGSRKLTVKIEQQLGVNIAD